MRSRREERMVTIALPGGGGAAGGPEQGGSLEGIFISGEAGSKRGAVIAPPTRYSVAASSHRC